jgi:hypothetical protein
MTLLEWERNNSTVEEYYHAGQYCAWVFHRKIGIVTATGDTKAEARENLASQLGVDP